jgi:Cu(I)/Ag(I) efflux system membrane fusion protein
MEATTMSEYNTDRTNNWMPVAIGLMGIAIGALAVVIAMQAGWLGDAAETTVAEEAPLYWVAPIDSNYRRDEPGLSPMGMELVPVYAGDADASDSGVRVSPAVLQNLGVRTGPVVRGSLQPSVDAVAYVSYDEDRMRMVHTRVAGWVESLGVRAINDPVAEGQVLFELYAPELVTAQEEFVAALGTGNRSLINASRQRLTALGLSDSIIARIERDRRVVQRIPVIAPSSGVVTELNAREGMYLQPAVLAMVIADPAAVWLVAEVLERQAGAIAVGQVAAVTLAALPGETLMGRVDYLYPELDARSRSLRVRIRLDAPDARVRPNMYAQASLRVAPITDALHVPREAVIRSGAGARVVVDRGDGRFQTVAVRTGAEVGDRVVILDGLEAGQSVVISGQFLIDSESNIDAEVLRASEEQMIEAAPEPEERNATVRGVFLGWHSDGERIRIRHQRIASRRTSATAPRSSSIWSSAMID